METKACLKCGEAKPPTEFYAQTRGGLTARCKTCIKAYWAEKKKDASWLLAERVRCREKIAKARASGKKYAPSSAVRKAYRLRNKSKIRTRHLAERAVRLGQLPIINQCQECGKQTKLHKHHPDYSQPLTVEWLCSACHGVRHRKAA